MFVAPKSRNSTVSSFVHAFRSHHGRGRPSGRRARARQNVRGLDLLRAASALGLPTLLPTACNKTEAEEGPRLYTTVSSAETSEGGLVAISHRFPSARQDRQTGSATVVAFVKQAQEQIRRNIANAGRASGAHSEWLVGGTNG